MKISLIRYSRQWKRWYDKFPYAIITTGVTIKELMAWKHS